MTDTFHRLTVSEVRKEIGGNATSLMFDVPSELGDIFRWQAGQHLTLRLEIDGVEHRRSYTISNPPDEQLRVTVKRVKGGVVSNHIGDHVRAGMSLEVMPPFGGFTLIPETLARRTHYFFGAGSGITPLYAMISTVLENEPHSVAHLVFGNANADGILFREELDALAKSYPDRFTIRHVLSSPSLWNWFSPWRSGRVDASVIDAAISEQPPVAQDVQYWICGPGSMNGDVKAALLGLDVPANRVHMESFGGAGEVDTSVTGMAAVAQVRLAGRDHEVPIAKDQTILDAVRAAGLSPSFSCQSGVCGACRARLITGQVHMRRQMALEEAEVERGDILTCQSVATSDSLRIEFSN